MRRLIAFILVFALFLAFIGFNLENKCDVSFGIKIFSEVPVFLTAFFSFVLGMVFAVPFLLGRMRKNISQDGPSDSTPSSGETKKRRGLKSKKNAPKDDTSDEIKKETSLYGVD